MRYKNNTSIEYNCQEYFFKKLFCQVFLKCQKQKRNSEEGTELIEGLYYHLTTGILIKNLPRCSRRYKNEAGYKKICRAVPP